MKKLLNNVSLISIVALLSVSVAAYKEKNDNKKSSLSTMIGKVDTSLKGRAYQDGIAHTRPDDCLSQDKSNVI